MIAEDFGPVRTTLASRSPTESIAGLQSCEGQAPRAPRLKAPLEGARARARARVYTGPKDPRGRGQRSPYSARSSAIAVNFLNPQAFLTPTSGLVRNAG